MRTIICLGDSITAGKKLPEGQRWSALLQDGLDAATGKGWQVYNRGIPSETVTLGLGRFEKDVLPHLPGWVLVEFGLNDCSFLEGREIPRVGPLEFSAVLGEIIRLTRKGKGLPLLLTNHPPGTTTALGRRCADNLRPYQQAIRETARHTGCGLIDMEKLFGASENSAAGLVEDEIHFNAFGHAMYASLLQDAFLSLCATAPLLHEASPASS